MKDEDKNKDSKKKYGKKDEKDGKSTEIQISKFKGCSYDGDYNMNYQRHGLGTFIFANGEMYEGNYHNGRKEGFGTYRYADGSSYVGEWKAGVKCGQGTMTWANGTIYEGKWENGLPSGSGKEIYKNEDVYEGHFTKGLRDGQGCYQFKKLNLQYVGPHHDGEIWAGDGAINGSGVISKIGEVAVIERDSDDEIEVIPRNIDFALYDLEESKNYQYHLYHNESMFGGTVENTEVQKQIFDKTKESIEIKNLVVNLENKEPSIFEMSSSSVIATKEIKKGYELKPTGSYISLIYDTNIVKDEIRFQELSRQGDLLLNFAQSNQQIQPESTINKKSTVEKSALEQSIALRDANDISATQLYADSDLSQTSQNKDLSFKRRELTEDIKDLTNNTGKQPNNEAEITTNETLISENFSLQSNKLNADLKPPKVTQNKDFTDEKIESVLSFTVTDLQDVSSVPQNLDTELLNNRVAANADNEPVLVPISLNLDNLATDLAGSVEENFDYYI